jgi:hypothetical protein
MVVKARDDVTVATLNDVAMVLPYYITQSNTASAPATPTTNPPTGGWTNAEPTYNSSNTVYISFLTVFSDGSFDWSTPSKSSNYEAAKAAYNKATSAYDTANNAQTSANRAIFAALPSLLDTTKPNSWLCAIFPAANGSSVQTLPSYSLIAPLAASYTKYQDDGTGDILTKAVNYSYGLIRTLVSFSADTTWTFTYSHDDGSRIYVDGVNVFECAQYTKNDPVTISFAKGNHIVDVMYSNALGGAGIWAFSVALSSIATTMYAPAGASVLATALDKAQAAAKNAQTTADGKNKIFPASSEPEHNGLVPGDLWFQLNSSKQVTGIQMWNGSAFVDYVLMANEIIAAKTITGDKLDVSSVAAAIVTSGLFQTASSGARVKMDSSGIKGYDANGSMTFEIDATTGNVAMIGKFYSGDPSVSRVIIDNDYNNIDDPQYVDVDGYVAFESHSSDKSPFIGGTHGTRTGTKYTGTIVTSGVTDSKTPSGASIQLASFDNGDGSSGTLASNMDKGIIGKNAARVDVHSGKDGQMASLMAIDGTANGNYAAVKAYVNPNGDYRVDIVAKDIYQVDPITGDAAEIYSNYYDLRSKKRCVFNWENSWSGVSNSGPGYLEGTFNFSMIRGWYLVETYVRTNGVGKEYHLDMLAKRTDGTLMDSWSMNFPMPSTGIGNMVSSQMVYVDDSRVDLAAQLYSRDYGTKPELFSQNDGKWSLFYPKKPLGRYFRIFAM